MLRGMDSRHLGRQAVEQLFGVWERRAWQLMAGLSGMRAGNAIVVSRSLIERLEDVGKGVDEVPGAITLRPVRYGSYLTKSWTWQPGCWSWPI